MSYPILDDTIIQLLNSVLEHMAWQFLSDKIKFLLSYQRSDDRRRLFHPHWNVKQIIIWNMRHLCIELTGEKINKVLYPINFYFRIVYIPLIDFFLCFDSLSDNVFLLNSIETWNSDKIHDIENNNTLLIH